MHTVSSIEVPLLVVFFFFFWVCRNEREKDWVCDLAYQSKLFEFKHYIDFQIALVLNMSEFVCLGTSLSIQWNLQLKNYWVIKHLWFQSVQITLLLSFWPMGVCLSLKGIICTWNNCSSSLFTLSWHFRRSLWLIRQQNKRTWVKNIGQTYKSMLLAPTNFKLKKLNWGT